jgi:hypothetical protein
MQSYHRRGDLPLVRDTRATPGYFETMEIPLLRGRPFSPEDRADSLPGAIINESMAARRTWLKKYLADTKEPELGAPLIAGAHWSLGLVYEKENHRPGAIAELQTALRIKPDFEPAKKDLKRITGR